MLFFILLFSSILSFYACQFEQKLNHLDTHDDRYFNQTYYLDFEPNQTLKHGNFIIVLDDFKAFQVEILQSKAVLQLKEAAHAHIIGLEHRFFGHSRPQEEISKETQHFLLIQQFLFDIEHFIEYIQNNFCSEKCSVGIIGTGFGGSLATWSRIRYPHLVSSVWASSAILHFQPEFEIYDGILAPRLNSFKSNCFNNTKRIFDEIETILDDGDHETVLIVKQKFDFSEDQNDVSLLNTLGEVFLLPFQNKNWTPLLQDHCDSIVSTPTIDTLSSHYHNILEYLNRTAKSFDPYLSNQFPDHRSLLFLQCNQIGLFRTSSSLKSKKVGLDFFDDVCQTQFNISIFNSTETNHDFGDADPYISNAIFTHGSNDPYSNLTVRNSKSSIGRFSYTFETGFSPDFSDLSDDVDKGIQYCVKKMSSWINRDCENKCQMGTCILYQCVCEEMWDGEFCDSPTHTLMAFSIVSGLCIFAPTVILLFFGIFVFFCGTKEETQIDKSRKNYFT